MSLLAARTEPDLALPWGMRVLPEAPAFHPARQSPSAARAQVGLDVRTLGRFALGDRRALVVALHRVSAESMFTTGGYDAARRDQIARAADGLSVVTLRCDRSGRWVAVEPERAPYNRRVHDRTPARLVGPASDDPRLRDADAPRGRTTQGVGPLATGDRTPWDSVVTAERDVAGPRAGWVVEVDPFRPGRKPRKHTLLGRLDHDVCSVEVHADGTVAVLLADRGSGRRFRFVARDRWAGGAGAAGSRRHRKLLDTGTLWAAREDVSGDDYADPDRWVELTTETASRLPGWSVADVLLDPVAAAAAAR